MCERAVLLDSRLNTAQASIDVDVAVVVLVVVVVAVVVLVLVLASISGHEIQVTFCASTSAL